MSTNNSIKETNNEEYIDDCEGIGSRSYNLLQTEYEKCRQEIHDLKRQLRLNETMLREAQETNELLERSLDRQIAQKDQLILELEEKYRNLAKEYENVISNLEGKVAQQTREIEELRQQQRADRSAKTETETKRVPIADRSANLSCESDNVSLRNRIDQLLSILQEEKRKYERAEEMIEELTTRCDEFEQHSRHMKERLDEKSQALEEARAELILKRTEAMSLEAVPRSELHKGNSLFAEVEDRRQNAMNKMNALRDKYAELKRICKSQLSEIKMLRAERVAALRKWENDMNYGSTETEELMQRYKNRISELQNKLKAEIKKNNDSKQFNCTDASFGYFQSLLDAKRKETDELRITVEDLSTKLLVQKETTSNITKQLCHWRHKASILEAQMCAAQTELKLDAMDDAEHETLRESQDLSQHCNNDTKTIDEPRSNDFMRTLPIGCSSKSDAIYRSADSHDRSIDREETTKSCEFEQQQKSNNCRNKVVQFMENASIKNSKNIQTTNQDSKYPVIYIPTNF